MPLQRAYYSSSTHKSPGRFILNFQSPMGTNWTAAEDYDLAVPEEEFRRIDQKITKLRLRVKEGALQLPWLVGYTIESSAP